MLIEFSVSNFRSFREKQTLSMVAAPRLRKRENVFSPTVEGEKLPDLLKVAAIYGPNASGKSNLLEAMDIVPMLANATPATVKTIPVSPFRFDKALALEPSKFEVHFVHKGQRYQFDLSVTSERIVEERLTGFPRGKPSLLYERSHKDGVGDQYSIGENLEGGAELHQAWRRLTGPTSLFISQAVANSSEELKQLRYPHTWLTSGMFVIDRGLTGLAASAQALVKRTPALASNVSLFLQEVDVPVTSMRVDTKSEHPVQNKLASLAMQNNASPNKEVNRTTFTHRTALGEAEFDFSEESEGTKGLIGFWLPWSMMADRDAPFKMIAVDELDSSLHPEIVATLVKKYLTYEECAQLVFTTHDTHLMDTKLLRRDQFWLTERDVNGATQLRSIHDFDGRESEDIEKRYYEGRYRGLPVLRKG
jgi:AAA15 family ATPase/GTPase